MGKFIPYEHNGKTLRIPLAEIERNMQILKLTEVEAVQMWLEDNGHEINEEQEALDKKARENKITAKIHQARAYTPKTQKERVHKEDKTKEGFIKNLAEILADLEATEIEIVNPSKLITFKLGNETFKLDLIRQRPPKDKGKA